MKTIVIASFCKKVSKKFHRSYDFRQNVFAKIYPHWTKAVTSGPSKTPGSSFRIPMTELASSNDYVGKLKGIFLVLKPLKTVFKLNLKTY